MGPGFGARQIRIEREKFSFYPEGSSRNGYLKIIGRVGDRRNPMTVPVREGVEFSEMAMHVSRPNQDRPCSESVPVTIPEGQP
jgi:hypothetical protein